MRNVHVETLEQACSSIHLVAGLGFEPVKDTNTKNYTTNCPVCHNRLFVLPHGFLCENMNCDLKAGGVVDVLRYQQNLPDYHEAVSRLLEMFPERFHSHAYLREPKIQRAVAGHLQKRRNILEFFLRIARHVPATKYDCDLRNHLRAGLGEDLFTKSPYLIFPIWESMQDAWEEFLTEQGVRRLPNLNRNSRPFIIPYFTNHHTLGALLYKSRFEDDSPQIFEVEPSKYQFSGLLQAGPYTNKYHLVPSYVGLAKQNLEFSNSAPTNVALGFLYKSSEVSINWMPAQATYIENKKRGHNKWTTLLNLGRDMDLRLSNGPGLSEDLPIVQRIVDVVYDTLLSAGFTQETLQLIDLLQLYDSASEALKVKLSAAGHHELTRGVVAHLKHKVLDVEGEDKLIQTEDGYMHSRKGVDTSISNFVVEFKRSIRFYGSPDVYYDVNLVNSQYTVPMLLPHQSLHQPRQLEKSLQQFPKNLITDHERKQIPIPVMHETSGRRVGMLMRAFKKVCGKLPIAEGITSLGWTPDRKTFFGPSWVADEDGVRYARMVFHPGNPILSHYDPEEAPVRKVHTQLPLDGQHMIAQIIAVIFRNFHNIPVMPVAVLREVASETLLRNMFAAIGQKTPIHFNESQWLRGVDLQGFPSYGTGCEYPKIKNIKQGVFMLSERGWSAVDTYSSDVYDLMGQTLRAVLHECLDWMLTGENVTFEYHRSVDPTCILSKEGKRVIERALGIEWNIRTPTYNALDGLLSQIPFNKTHEFMKEDLNRQVFELKLSDLVEVDSTDLQMELRQFVGGVVVSDSSVTANIADMRQLVATYYQDVPHVEQVFVPPTT